MLYGVVVKNVCMSYFNSANLCTQYQSLHAAASGNEQYYEDPAQEGNCRDSDFQVATYDEVYIPSRENEEGLYHILESGRHAHPDGNLKQTTCITS